VQGTDQHEFTGHYSSTALRSVKSFVPRLGLHTQIKERLHDTLENRGRSCKILVVCGLGGAGKSQLVLNYVEDFKDDYTATFWIDASSKERLEADYKQIHNLLLRPTQVDTAIDTCVSEIRHWCRPRGTRRYLFVLDSADSIDDESSPEYIDLLGYIVDATSADVVITTRVQSAKEMTTLEAVQVAELAPDESREIFKGRLALVDSSLEVQKEIDEVTEELGHFALAVSLAAAYVAGTRRLRDHPAGYLLEYAERKKTLLARRPKKHIDQYGESVLTTWETSYAAIASQYPEACNLLTFLSFLDSSNIFTELLDSSYEEASEIFPSMILVPTSKTSLKETLDDGFRALELYSLLQWNDQHEAHSMHKLVQTWAFERLESDEQVTFCFAAWNYLQHLCWRTIDLPAMQRRLISQVMACFVKVRALCHVGSLATEDVVGLVSSLASFLHMARQLDFAYELQSFSHQCHEQQLFVDPIVHAESLFLLASILGSQRKYDAAEQLLRQALGKLDEPLPKEHVWIKESCQRSLAQLLIHRDKSYSEAEQMLRCLLDQQRQRNASEIDEAKIMFVLSGALMGQGRYREAEKLYKQMLDRPKEVINTYRNMITIQLSRTLRYQGKLAEAEEVARRESNYALIHGATDNRAEKALVALGKVKLAQKAYAEAATLFGQAYDATATPNNSTHLVCQIRLARALRHLPSHDKALVAYTRAIDGYGRFFGGEHRCTRRYSREFDAFRAFLAKKEIWKAKCERTSLRIARALGAGQALVNRVSGLSISRRRSASSSGQSRGKIERTRRHALEAQPHHHTTECA
jgi:tetratricopeptide (TPR) repeat protein